MRDAFGIERISKGIPTALRATALSPRTATYRYQKVFLTAKPKYAINRASANKGGREASKTIAQLRAGKGNTEDNLRYATNQIRAGKDMRRVSRGALKVVVPPKKKG